MTENLNEENLDRVDGRAKVTGTAKYTAEYELPGMAYGVLVGSSITRGTIAAIDSKAAEKAAGVISVISHLNSIKVPGYDVSYNPAKGPSGGRGLQVFGDNYVRYNGQPVALVIADTFEKATHAASLIKVRYVKEEHATSLEGAITNGSPLEGPRYNDYSRGELNKFDEGPVKVFEEYTIPVNVHNPMEIHATIAMWHGDDKVTVYEKTQGVKSAQRSIMQAFKLEEKNVQVHAEFVGGGFGSALRTWPHAIAALIGAKKIGKPLKLLLTREQMFYMVGYRPRAVQQVGISATRDGKFVGISHTAHSHTSNYEEFTEGIVNMSRFMYTCPNVQTKYKVYPLDVSTPTWMRGPGEATGAFALESAIDELAYALNMDPLELRLKNYAETDPQRNLPYSSKFLKEAYEIGAEKFGWKSRPTVPRTLKEGDWLVGYGVGSGVFGASRGEARAIAKLSADGTLVIQSAVADSGPGTATAMVQIAASTLSIDPKKVTFELGDSSYPPGPTQGGSTTTSTLGSVVHIVSTALKSKLFELVRENDIFHTATNHTPKIEDIVFQNGSMMLKSEKNKRISYSDAIKGAGLTNIEVTETSKPNEEARKYASYSYSVFFVKVLVNNATGEVRVAKVVAAIDGGKIISYKTAESQIIGGVVGGIGMALMEEGVFDHRYGRWVNKNFADYHMPVHADVPHIDVLFVNKPDPIINPIGSKGIGEVSIIGLAPAVANAVFNATGIRVRKLPITPDKLI